MPFMIVHHHQANGDGSHLIDKAMADNHSGLWNGSIQAGENSLRLWMIPRFQNADPLWQHKVKPSDDGCPYSR